MTTYPKNTDFIVRFEAFSTVWTFEPLTDNAKQWADLNLGIEDWQWVGDAFGVDHRPAKDLLEFILSEGFSVFHPTHGYGAPRARAA